MGLSVFALLWVWLCGLFPFRNLCLIVCCVWVCVPRLAGSCAQVLREHACGHKINGPVT